MTTAVPYQVLLRDDGAVALSLNSDFLPELPNDVSLTGLNLTLGQVTLEDLPEAVAARLISGELIPVITFDSTGNVAGAAQIQINH